MKDDGDGQCVKCWPPYGFDTVREFTTHMSESGLWGSDEYFVWKQRKIRWEGLRKRMLVSADDYPKDFPDEYYPGWMDKWGCHKGIIEVDEFKAVASAMAEKMTPIEYKNPPFVLNYTKTGPPMLHMAWCRHAKVTKEWKELTAEELKTYKEQYVYYRCMTCNSYEEDDNI